MSSESPQTHGLALDEEGGTHSWYISGEYVRFQICERCESLFINGA